MINYKRPKIDTGRFTFGGNSGGKSKRVIIKHFTFRGAALLLQSDNSPELILSGPYETGKTIACLTRVNNLLATYKGSRWLMVRKTYKSLINSVIPTWEKKIHRGKIGEPSYPITKLGKSRPEWYDYPNGARLILGGMDNSSKFLSAEFDGIYAPQCEELTLDDWEQLLGRATGRAGNAPFTQVLGDCNPGPPHHWILKRKRIKLMVSKHRDNPTLYDERGNLTPQGKISMEALSSLTGLRYKRGRVGLWVAAEGQVYEFDQEVHHIDPFPIPKDWYRFLAIDFGYTNPFVCQWWAVDHDGRMYLYREIYKAGAIVEDHTKEIVRLNGIDKIKPDAIADHDAEDRATMRRYGLNTLAAYKAINRGIEAVETRLKIQGDGKPRLFIMKDCTLDLDPDLDTEHKPTSTAAEFGLYIYPPSKDGRNEKEQPIKHNDHGMDALRYAVAFVDGLSYDDKRGNNDYEVLTINTSISDW